MGAGGITISDSAGNLRVFLRLKGEGSPFLVFTDKSEKVRVSISCDAVRINDTNGNSSVILNIGEDGPALTLAGQNENPRASMALVKDGACIILFDETHDRIHLTAAKDQASIVFNDAAENPRIGIAIGKEGSGSLAVLDCEGHVVQGLGEE